MHPQAPPYRGIRGRHDAGFLQHAGAAGLAARLDDPGDHQLAEHLVAVGGVLEPQDPVGVLQGVAGGPSASR